MTWSEFEPKGEKLNHAEENKETAAPLEQRSDEELKKILWNENGFEKGIVTYIDPENNFIIISWVSRTYRASQASNIDKEDKYQARVWDKIAFGLPAAWEDESKVVRMVRISNAEYMWEVVKQGSEEIKQDLNINKMGVLTAIGTINVFDKEAKRITFMTKEGKELEATEWLKKLVFSWNSEFQPWDEVEFHVSLVDNPLVKDKVTNIMPKLESNFYKKQTAVIMNTLITGNYLQWCSLEVEMKPNITQHIWITRADITRKLSGPQIEIWMAKPGEVIIKYSPYDSYDDGLNYLVTKSVADADLYEYIAGFVKNAKSDWMWTGEQFEEELTKPGIQKSDYGNRSEL